MNSQIAYANKTTNPILAAEVSPSSAALSDMMASVEHLASSVAQLRKKLDPILQRRPEAVEKDPMPEAKYSSSFLTEMQSATDRVHRLATELDKLSSIVEL